jgi:aminopeptidase-like protein
VITGASTNGAALHAFAAELYPICRSITGAGLRKTLNLIGRHIDLEIIEVPTGTRVFDWEVPLEWNIEDAYVLDADGHRVVDFRSHNLHVVNYSEPIHATMSLDSLDPHLHSLPANPQWIPYRTSYFQRQWGFCMRHRDRERLRAGSYQVHIDSSLARGSLTYGECVVPGRSEDEILFFTHACHPSLANDNTSGLSVATSLANWVASESRRFSYRFVFAPGAIGTLCWLKRNEKRLSRVRHGLVLGLLGDRGQLTYKCSRRGSCEIDRIVPFALQSLNLPNATRPFEPYGYSERQLCSPGFNLPVGRLTRSVNGGYPEYHTSGDDLDLITAQALEESLDACKRIVEVLEHDRRYVNVLPKGEPRLGKRGLYGSLGGQSPADREHAMLWVLSQSDGVPSLVEIAERSGMSFEDIRQAAADLLSAGLLRLSGRRDPVRATARMKQPPKKSNSSVVKGKLIRTTSARKRGRQ